MTPLPALQIAISACLLGEAVRYDGTHRRHDRLLAVLGPAVSWLPVCPEVELGLGVPRPRIHLVDGLHGVRLVTEGSGRDLTDAMATLAEERMADLARVAGYVFKSKSPSCGIAAGGMFAAAVMARFPQLPVIEERDLDSDDAIAAFAARARAYAVAHGQA